MNPRFSLIVRAFVACGFIFTLTGAGRVTAFASIQPKLIHFQGPGLQAILVTPPVDPTTTEASGTATIAISLNSAPLDGTDVTIPVSSSDETEGTANVSQLIFTPVDLGPKDIIVTGQEDLIVDGSISYNIVLGTVVSDDPAYSGADPADINLTNLDNDPGIIVDAGDGINTSEAGPGTDTFTIVLSTQPSGGTVDISLSSNDPTEGQDPAPVTFTTSNWDSPKTVTVTGVNDDVADGPQLYTISTPGADQNGGDGEYNGLTFNPVSVTNSDDDTAGILLSPASGLITTEAAGTATFDVSLTSQPTADVSVALASSNELEGTVLPATMIFTAADWSTTQQATITGVDDDAQDGPVDYQIDVGVSASDDPVYAALPPVAAAVTNQDNDVAGITVSPTSGLVTTEAAGTATFTVVLNTQPAADVTIGLTSNDTSEGTVLPSSLTFTSANWSTARTVTVTGVDDLIIDGDIGYTIVTANAVSTDANYSGRVVADVSVTNQDDDAAGFLIDPLQGLITTEDGGTAQFTVALDSQPASDVTLPLQSSNTAEGTIAVASLTFTTANWNVPKPVIITGVDDDLADGSIDYSILTGPVTSADPNYDGVDADDVSVVNADNDTAGITFSPSSNLVTTEGQGTATINIVLNTEPLANVVITLTSSDPGEGIFNLGDGNTNEEVVVTFSPTSWASIQSVKMQGVDDLDEDGDVPYKVQVVTQSDDPKYDGQNQELSAINKDAPTIDWVKPEDHDPYYETSSLDPILLAAEPISDEPVSYVRFYRSGTSLGQPITLFEDQIAPYEFYLDPQELDPEWNQIYVYAVYNDGDPTQSKHERLLIYFNSPSWLYLPLLGK